MTGDTRLVVSPLYVHSVVTRLTDLQYRVDCEQEYGSDVSTSPPVLCYDTLKAGALGGHTR